MASISIKGMNGWGNPCSRLLDAIGPSPSHRGGLRAPFFFGRRVAGMADHMRPRVWTSPFFQRPVQHDVPLYPRFLRRPRLLTRLSSPSLREGVPPCYPLALRTGPREGTDLESKSPDEGT
jgi:hypothetical protein